MHTHTHTLYTHRADVYSAQLLGIWSSKDVLFWEQLQVSPAALVTAGGTGCANQTRYKRCNTSEYPPTHHPSLTHTHRPELTLTALLFLLIPRSISPKGERVVTYKLTSPSPAARGMITALPTALSKTLRSGIRASLTHNAAGQDAGVSVKLNIGKW